MKQEKENMPNQMKVYIRQCQSQLWVV